MLDILIIYQRLSVKNLQQCLYNRGFSHKCSDIIDKFIAAPCSSVVEIGIEFTSTTTLSSQTPPNSGKLFIFESPAIDVKGKLKAVDFISKVNGEIYLMLLERVPPGKFTVRRKYRIPYTIVGINHYDIPDGEEMTVTSEYVVGVYAGTLNGGNVAYEDNAGRTAYEKSLTLAEANDGAVIEPVKLALAKDPAIRLEIDTGK